MRALFGTLPWRAADERGAGARRPELQGRRWQDLVDLPPGPVSRASSGYRVCVDRLRQPGVGDLALRAQPGRRHRRGDRDALPVLPAWRAGQDLDYALRPTYWPGIALIPANLGLYDAEYEFAARLMQRERPPCSTGCATGIETIRDRFDVILMDPPPALGMISLSVLRAADALLIPAPPNNIDFASTGHFLRMMVATLTELARSGRSPVLSVRAHRHDKAERDQGRPRGDQADDGQRLPWRDAACGAARLGRDRQCRRQPDDGLRDHRARRPHRDAPALPGLRSTRSGTRSRR